MTAERDKQAAVERQQIRTFHLTGRGLEEFRPAAPLRLAGEEFAPPSSERAYPLWAAKGRRPVPLWDLFEGIEHRAQIVGAVAGVLEGRPWLAGAEASKRLLLPVEECSEAELLEARARMAGDAIVAGFDSRALPAVYASILSGSRAPAREQFAERMKAARDNLSEIIAADDAHAPEAAGPAPVAASLGGQAAVYLDAEMLARTLRAPVEGARRMSPERRARIERAIATLDDALQSTAAGPAFRLFHPPELPANGIERWGGWSEPSLEPFHDGMMFCQRQLEWFAAPLRALRLARLEAVSAYDASIHDEALRRLDWQSASEEELAALAPVVIVETTEGLATASLTGFSRALRSGMPLQVLITRSGFGLGELGEAGIEPGYLAMVHRESFVVQGTMARPAELPAMLEAMADSLRPAVAVVATPERDANPLEAWEELSLLDRAHAAPPYRYDPERGETWAERFEILAGPVEPEAEETVPVTAAHAAALSRHMLDHFRVLPPSAFSDDQVELDKYLAEYRDRPPLGIPFLWVLSPDGARQRAICTRELAALCRDRLRSWRAARALASPPATQPQAAAAAPDAEQARAEGARQALLRLVASLTGQEATASAIPGAAPAPAPTQVAPAPSASAAAAPAPSAAAPMSAEEAVAPYVESYMCTSCNDCRKINPRLFGYDANQQAYIADPAAGTFAELVKAAEGCPAKCIHPGTPAPGDKTVTADLRARAAKFR
jgi:ferredoxin